MPDETCSHCRIRRSGENGCSWEKHTSSCKQKLKKTSISTTTITDIFCSLPVSAKKTKIESGDERQGNFNKTCEVCYLMCINTINVMLCKNNFTTIIYHLFLTPKTIAFCDLFQFQKIGMVAERYVDMELP